VPSDRPIFVVGCPRSGTTLMQLMLHAHPRIAIPPETRFTLRAYDRRRHFGDLTDPANRRLLAEFIAGPGNSFADLGLPGQDIIEAIVAGPPTLGSAAAIVFRAYSDRFGKARWGDKRPAYLLNMDILLWMFPDAQIIHVVRDGRDCVASMKDQPWHLGGINHAISQWRRGMSAARRATKRLRPDQFVEVAYERLVSEPQIQLAHVCEVLGEEFVPSMIEPSLVAKLAVPRRKTWHSLTHGAVTTERVGSWQQRLTDPEIALCESLMGRQLAARGYELSDAHSALMRHRAEYLQHTALGTYKRSRRKVKVALDKIRGSRGFFAYASEVGVAASPNYPKTSFDEAR
jgi:hypothetical protein